MDRLGAELSGRQERLGGEIHESRGALEVSLSGAAPRDDTVPPAEVELDAREGRLSGELSGTRRTLDVSLSGVSSAAAALQDKTVTPTEAEQTVKADRGYAGLGTVTVAAIPEYYGRISYDGAVLTVS